MRRKAEQPFTLIVMLLMAGILCSLAPWGFSQEATSDPDGPTFSLNASETRFLPPAMYGTWNIETKVLKSNAPPWLFTHTGNELWTLSRDSGTVTLTNIVTHAAATITVDEVNGDTATFHHVATDTAQRMKIKETPTITVEGDKIYGINRQELTLLRRGKPHSVFHLEIQLEGRRLAGAQVLFRDPEIYEPKLEVAPLQFEDR